MKINYLLYVLLASSCLLWADTLAAEPFTEKLIAIRYTGNEQLKDSTFEYDAQGNVTLRATQSWREENSYDAEHRRISREVFQEVRGEMTLQLEQAWAYDGRGNLCLDKYIDYAHGNNNLCRASYDDADRLLTRANYWLINEVWQQQDSVSYIYDDANNTWTEYAQKVGGTPAQNVHYCDASGQDTLIYTYHQDEASGTWQLTRRTLFTFCEYGVTCILEQRLYGDAWIDSYKTETAYHGSSEDYTQTRSSYWYDEEWPESSEWYQLPYEYNYYHQGNILHIWGDNEGHFFDDEYEYDEQGRVIRHAYNSTSHSHNIDTYEFDSYGNLTDLSEYDSMMGTCNHHYDYTYDENGAILAIEEREKDYFASVLSLKKTTTYEYDTSVPATSVINCPSPYYKLLSTTETDPAGNETITTYDYAPTEGLQTIKGISAEETQLRPLNYNLLGQPVRNGAFPGFRVNGRVIIQPAILN